MTKVALSQVFRDFPGTIPAILPDLEITGITADSRQVSPGTLFIAQSGTSFDGHHFIPQAVAAGAAAVVGTQDIGELPVPYLRVNDSRQALAFLASGFYDRPAEKLVVIGVTGTDGKTTTANLLYEMLKIAGIKVGMISTVNAVIGNEALDTGFHVTTPEAPDVQRYLAHMVSSGLTHVVLEATSHGLAQHRVDACGFDFGVVTNITHEHLDYHQTYEDYRSAKGILFQELGRWSARKPEKISPAAILNYDDPAYAYLAATTPVRSLSYGRNAEADVRAENIVFDRDRMHFRVVGLDFHFEVSTPLIGLYNVSNSLAAIATIVGGLGLPFEVAQQALAEFSGVPGRMERIEMGQSFTAIVDFAHTPNALENALQTVQQISSGRVIAVFGSAGLRDRAKRRMMAEVSAELADISVFTAEDPRTESLAGILAEMADGAISKGGVEGKSFWRVPDRREALRFALSLAKPGDVVIACGKGHEQSMCFGNTEYAWDDRTALRAALAEYLGIEGPAMPYLPSDEA